MFQAAAVSGMCVDSFSIVASTDNNSVSTFVPTSHHQFIIISLFQALGQRHHVDGLIIGTEMLYLMLVLLSLVVAAAAAALTHCCCYCCCCCCCFHPLFYSMLVADARVFVLLRTILRYGNLFIAGSWLSGNARLGVNLCWSCWSGTVCQ